MQLYFRSQFMDVPRQLQNLLMTGRKSSLPNKSANVQDRSEINFREEIAKGLFYQPSYKPLDLDFLLVRQLFSTSLDVADPVMSATVSDIIYIYNELVEKKGAITDGKHGDDPIAMLINDLGNKPIASRFPTETLRARINLRISCRFLIQFSQIVKCSECHAPVTNFMIPAARFSEAHGGKGWVCQAHHCQKPNKAGAYQCVSCQASIPPSELAADLVFKRFRHERP